MTSVVLEADVDGAPAAWTHFAGSDPQRTRLLPPGAGAPAAPGTPWGPCGPAAPGSPLSPFVPVQASATSAAAASALCMFPLSLFGCCALLVDLHGSAL